MNSLTSLGNSSLIKVELDNREREREITIRERCLLMLVFDSYVSMWRRARSRSSDFFNDELHWCSARYDDIDDSILDFNVMYDGYVKMNIVWLDLQDFEWPTRFSFSFYLLFDVGDQIASNWIEQSICFDFTHRIRKNKRISHDRF